jgi:hypothetical protein
VHPFRIAILIFLVGASSANYLVLKKTVSQDEDYYPQYRVKYDAQATDSAWIGEIIILTVAGVAWFLVRPKSTS